METIFRRFAIEIYQLVTGRHVLDRLDELNRTQWLTYAELQTLQREKLHQLLAYARVNIPYYNRLFKKFNFNPDEVLTDPQSLRKLPVLTKSVVNANLNEMMTVDSSRRAKLSKLSTSGSTGQPLFSMQDNNYRDCFTADVLRHLGWAGWQFGQPHAYIWGGDFEARTAQTLRTRLMDWTLNRFLTNAYFLSDESMSAFAERVKRRKPAILFGYASSIYSFAQFVQSKRLDITFNGIFSTAEVLFPAQRAFIEDVFQTKMFNRYGTREFGGIACECDAHTGLHVSMDNNYIEILDRSGQPLPPGEAGDIIVTNLNNYGVPLIRYAVDDVGAWNLLDNCPCGRELPLLDVILGRQPDLFKTKDGREIYGGFAGLLFHIPGVKQFQVIQKSLDLVVARIVHEGDLEQTRLDAIEKAVKTVLGADVVVRFEFPEKIPVLNSGKHRYWISEVSG
jgi:phenylacetate-CoA ligase